MTRLRMFLCLVLASTALAGCNETSGGTGLVASAPYAPTAYHVAGGAPCSGEIDSYQAVVAHDLQTGNVEQKVADQIHAEVSRAAAACSAGQNAQAHAIVASSKAKHGYRA